MKYALLIEGDKAGEAMVYGPFDTHEDARSYGDEILGDQLWVVIPLHAALCDETGNWE